MDAISELPVDRLGRLMLDVIVDQEVEDVSLFDYPWEYRYRDNTLWWRTEHVIGMRPDWVPMQDPVPKPA